jgi:hypothetical protein
VFRFAGAVAHQAAGGDEPTKFKYGGQPTANGQRGKLFDVSREEVVRRDVERVGVEVPQLIEHRIELALECRT